MKKGFPLVLVLLAFCSLLMAQSPATVPYQAVARDASGNLLVNQNVCVQFSIYNQSSGGTLLYQEHHTVATNKLGLFNVSVGTGGVYDGGSASNLSGITWGSTGAFMEVALDVTGACSGYVTMGRSQMQSVPYALYAGNAASAGGTAGGDLTGSYPNPTLTTSGVSAGTYGTGSTYPVVTVDAKGRVTNVTTNALPASLPPSGTAGGDLTGSYPNPALATSGVTANTYGSATQVPVIAVDAKGRITSASTQSITPTGIGALSAVSVSAPLSGNGTSGSPVACATCVTSSTLSGFAAPANKVGISASAAGSASTAIRSDATFTIDQTIAPNWSGAHTFSNSTYSALFTGGNVGIGTATPVGKLNVALGNFSGGSLSAWSSSQLVIGGATTTSGALGFAFDGSSNAVGTIYSLAPNSAWQDLAVRTNNTVFYASGGTEALRVASNGDVGIATPSPTYKLDVGGTERVTGTLTVGGTASFTGSTYSALFSGGTVGIGTATPDQALTIDGTTPIAEIRSGGYLQLRPTGNSWDMRLQAVGMQLNILSGGSLSSPIMSLLNGGNVGIGTTNPGYPLDVEIAYDVAAGYSGYGALYDGSSPAVYIAGNSGANTPVAIHTPYRMNASEYDAISDKRIKDIIDISNPCGDLSTLNEIEVTDFKYKDRVQYGNQVKKGFIAQQVESVFPEAVHYQTDFVPDIMAMSQSCSYDSAGHTLTLTLAKPHNLATGDKVKIITGHERKEAVVSSVITATRFSLANWTETADTVFVYGKQVNDFHVVDYDRIYTLNVSATQELARELDEAQCEIEQLKNRNAELEAKANAIQNAKADAGDVGQLKLQLQELKDLMEKNGIRSEK